MTDEDFGNLSDEEIENRRRDKELIFRHNIHEFLDNGFYAPPINPDDPRIGKLQRWANEYHNIWYGWISHTCHNALTKEGGGDFEDREEFLNMAADTSKYEYECGGCGLKYKLDEYEMDLVDNSEKRGESIMTPELRQELEKAAKEFFKKKSVTIRIASHAIEMLKFKASKLGIGYQTYINMLIKNDVSSGKILSK